MLTALFFVLLLAGGASRENVAGQVVVRAAAFTAIAASVVVAPPFDVWRLRGPAVLLLAAAALCAAQLVPLPPGIWRALPGRAAFADPLVSPPDLWRPLSLVPGATLNALFALVVPTAILLLMAGIRDDSRRTIPSVVLAVIAAALMVGLLQFTGAPIMNPLVNGSAGAVDGLLANRNHFALLLAIGLMMAPVWGLGDGTVPRIRAPIAIGVILVMILTILGSGSRAGIAIGALGLALGLAMTRRGLRATLRRYPRWVLPALGAGFVIVVATFVLVSIAADRAVSIDRLVGDDAGQDMRSRALPTVIAITRTYFPVGTGMGSFDPIFRMHEPFGLLKPTYFNHAHNDFLEVVLNAGIVGGLLLAAAIGWWAIRSWSAWRGAEILPKLGSSILLLVILASLVDYPARTPLFMAIVVVAACWLAPARPARAAAEGK